MERKIALANNFCIGRNVFYSGLAVIKKRNEFLVLLTHKTKGWKQKYYDFS